MYKSYSKLAEKKNIYHALYGKLFSHSRSR